jgi:hypothetical protein
MVGEQTHRQVGALQQVGRRTVVGEVDNSHGNTEDVKDKE